jgi:hypothetical protein
MATLAPGTGVRIRAEVLRRLSFLPPGEADLLIAVHEAGLKAPQSRSTQVVGFRAGELCWAGALSERHVEVVSEPAGDPRQLVAESIAAGPRLWEIVWPGELLRDPERGPLDTVYRDERPWLVVGQTPDGDLLAVPLNDATNPKWYTPLLARSDIDMAGSTKDVQVELAHLWSFPGSLGAIGDVADRARAALLEALTRYF